MTIRISIDAMGGDHGPSVTVPAVAAALARHPALEIVLFGDEAQLQPLLEEHGLAVHPRMSVEYTAQVVEMHERPSSALRGKRESSMRRAIDIVKDGGAAACVSAGNTGALMAMARFVLKTLPGIDRPAICATLPGIGHPTHMLDLGANVDSTSSELFQFAVMGAVLAEAVDNRPQPSVALLNIGEEEMKGNDRVKQTAALLERSPLNYAGFAEGNDIYSGRFDVIVCDGFVGNVALKASEGVARMLTEIAREEFKRSWLTRLGALCAMPALRALRNRADPRRYNGASLLGLRGTVIKSHGSADTVSYGHAIDVAVLEAEKAVPERIIHLLEKLLEESGQE
ncbi:MAG: phosphate acyltransferase PlsX [Gammaproteobacteria bacterium]